MLKKIKDKKEIEKLLLYEVKNIKTKDSGVIIKKVSEKGFNESIVRDVWIKLVIQQKIKLSKTEEIYMVKIKDEDTNVIPDLSDLYPNELTALVLLLLLPFILVYYLIKFIVKLLKF